MASVTLLLWAPKSSASPSEVISPIRISAGHQLRLGSRCSDIRGRWNNNSNTQHFPAAYPNTVAVIATNNNNQKAYFSNYGTWCDLCAPGESIISTV